MENIILKNFLHENKQVIESVMKKVISRKKYLINRDIIYSKEDLMQEMYLSLIEIVNVEFDIEKLKSEAFLYVTFLNNITGLERRTYTEKRKAFLSESLTKDSEDDEEDNYDINIGNSEDFDIDYALLVLVDYENIFKKLIDTVGDINKFDYDCYLSNCILGCTLKETAKKLNSTMDKVNYSLNKNKNNIESFIKDNILINH